MAVTTVWAKARPTTVLTFLAQRNFVLNLWNNGFITERKNIGKLLKKPVIIIMGERERSEDLLSRIYSVNFF